MRTILILIALGYTALACFAQSEASSFQKSPNHYGFIENKGQVADQHGTPRPEVRYLLPTAGLNVQLRTNGFSYDTYQWHNNVHPDPNADYGPYPEDVRPCYYHRIDVTFEGAEPDVQLKATERSSDYLNYYLAHLPEEGATYVHHYRRVLYRGVYPGIDVEFYIPEGGNKPVEYNIIIHPGGDPGRVKLRYDGAPVALEQGHNRLRFDTRHGTMYETVPASWYEADGQRYPVDVQYVALGGNTFGFRVANGGTSPPEHARLVIDPVPVVVWATYYGGSSFDRSLMLKTDSFENVFLVGHTQSLSSIATVGSHMSLYGGSKDGFMAKFDNTGTLLWGTYYGGGSLDEIRGIEISNRQHVYICGTTRSTSGIATGGTYQPVKPSSGSFREGFIARFTPAGVHVWGTYFGGSGHDDALSVAVDISDNLYLTGKTTSTAGISTPSAYQTAYGGGTQDAFLARMDSNGQRVWATYYGGLGIDIANKVVTDSSGNVYLAGETESLTLISTPGSHQSVFGGGASDGFIAKFSSAGSRIWGTYFGGDKIDVVRSMAIDHFGNVIAVGQTNSEISIATPGAYKTTWSAYNDGFIVKLGPNGNVAWSTYYGGTGDDDIRELFVAEDKGFYCATNSTSPGMASPFAPITSWSLEISVVITRFDSVGFPIYSTYHPGRYIPVSEIFTSIASTINGRFYVFGVTQLSGYATPGAHQTINNGANALLSLLDGRCFVIPYNNSPVCAGDTLFLHSGGGTTYQWAGPLGFQATTSEPFILNPQITASGTYTVTVSDTAGCNYFASTEVTVLPNPNFNTTGNSPVCEGDTLRISAVGGSSYQWAGPGGFSHSGKDVVIPNAAPLHVGSYALTITHANGCQRSGTATASLHPPVQLTAGSNSPVCEGKALQLTASGAASYQWTGPSGFGTNQANPVLNNAQLSASGTYRVVATDSAGCMDTAFVQVIVEVCTGIDPREVPGLSVHPNPTNGLLMVSATGPLELLELYDIAGRLVLRQRPDATTAEVGMSALPSGTYLLHVHAHSGRAVRTVVKE